MISDEEEKGNDLIFISPLGSEELIDDLSAQMWMALGYFTSDTKFQLPALEGEESVWKSLEELICENGKATPFSRDGITDEEKEKRREEVKMIRMELLEVKRKEMKIIKDLEFVSKRRDRVQGELRKLEDELAALISHSTQTDETEEMIEVSKPTKTTISTAFDKDVNENAPALPPILPDAGVDPLALLRPCDNAKKWIADKIQSSFWRLKANTSSCDRKELVQRTAFLFKQSSPIRCSFCNIAIVAATGMIDHISTKKHITAMNGNACKEAVKYWFAAVAEVSKQAHEIEQPSELVKVPSSKSEDQRSKPINSFVSSKNEEKKKEKGNVPLDILEFDLLRWNEKARNPCIDVKREMATLQRLFSNCNKKLLDADETLRSLFIKAVRCMACDKCAIDKPTNFIAHISTTVHVANMLQDNGRISQDAINYWLDAVKKATE